uniref:Uncharacterized protein n=1 Tax=Rhizophora mucronata TaxID=61149 RepID=A0A2P2MR83_RHIMU
MTHNAPYGRNSIQRYNERTSTTAALQQMHMEKVLVSSSHLSLSFQTLSILNHPFDDGFNQVDFS